LDALLAEAGGLASGLKIYGAELGITLIDEPRLRALAAEAAGKASDVGAAKSTRQGAVKAVQQADRAAARFLGAARLVFAIRHGNRWSTAWEPSGFPDKSTKVPRLQGQRRELCEKLRIYFTSHPELEVPAMEVTAALAESHCKALAAAHSALHQETAAKGTKMKARGDAKRKLRKTVYALKVLLKMTLPPDDSRWHSFGLNRPADGNVPERVVSVRLAQGRPGEIGASWNRAKLATRYRVFVMVAGVDEEFHARAPVKDPKATLEGFSAGQRVRVRVVAANKSGEARPSAEAEMVVG
jgi:hypothetical protein